MKKTKRVLALLLTLIMLFSLFVPGSVASAAGENVLVVETVSAAGEARHGNSGYKDYPKSRRCWLCPTG